MSDAQKTPLSQTLSSFSTAQALNEIQKRGTGLPGTVVAVSGPIVTVSFDVSGITLPNVTLPLFGPEYIRYPIQVGDLGVAFPVGLYIGGVSGLGGGTADTTLCGNLATLVWFPIGNRQWTASPNANATVLYGPQGVVIQDKSGTPNFSVIVNSSGITLSGGGHTVVLNSSGITIDSVLFATHDHGPGTYVAGSTAVTGDSGPVVG